MRMLTRLAAAITAAITLTGAQAGVVLSNVDQNLPNTTTLTPSGSSVFAKAVGFTTGDRLQRLETVRVVFSTDPGSSSTLVGAVFDDDGGQPGAFVAALEDTTVPADVDDGLFDVRPASELALEPSTTYWIVFSAPDATTSIRWQASTSDDPRTDAPTVFAGYRNSTDAGNTWSSSSFRNGVEIVTADPPAIANLPADAFTDATQIGNDFTKAVGVTIGNKPVCFDRMAATLASQTGGTVTVTGGIFENSAGNPGDVLAAFIPTDVPGGTTAPTQTVFRTAQPVILDANTTYWFRLISTVGGDTVLWPRPDPNTAPIATDGFTFAGYRFSTSNGVTWTDSSIFNGVSILMDPAPILANLPGEGVTTGGTTLGFDAPNNSVKAVGFTTGDLPLICPTFSLLMENENTTDELDAFGGIFTDNAGEPGTQLVALRPISIAPNTPNTVFSFVPVDPFFRLNANTTYWFFIDGEDNPTQRLRWSQLSPNVTPTPASGISFESYRFSDDNGASWVSSTTFNALSFKAVVLCVADLDGNGTLNFDDIDAFVAAFLASDLVADTDGNGILNFDDIDAFVASFLAGCD